MVSITPKQSKRQFFKLCTDYLVVHGADFDTLQYYCSNELNDTGKHNKVKYVLIQKCYYNPQTLVFSRYVVFTLALYRPDGTEK